MPKTPPTNMNPPETGCGPSVIRLEELELRQENARLRERLKGLEARQGGTGREAATARPKKLMPIAPEGGLGLIPAIRGELEGEAETEKIKVVRLRHRQPEQMRQTVMMLTSPYAQMVGIGHAYYGATGAATVPAAQGGFRPGLPGEYGAMRGWNVRIVADARTRSLIMRGSEEAVERAAKLIAAFDVPPGEEPDPEIEGMRAFRVRHVEPNHVIGVLQQLGIQAPALVVPETKVLLVPEWFPEIDSVGEVIKALDMRADSGRESERRENERD